MATEQLEKEVMDIFDYLHAHPEISWKEFNTTQYIKDFFEKREVRVTTFSDSTGVIAEIGSGKPVIGIRADMDALWQQVDGEFRANHSCGHDAHMSIVLGAFMLLQKTESALQGTVRFIFQPAEEKGTGALKMIEKGVADDLDFLYGVHLRPYQELENHKAAPAIYHGAAQTIKGKIIGEDAHGARPHLNVNAIEVGSALVQMLQGIHLNPSIPYSVKMTTFHAGGESANIIPGNANFSLDLRAQTNELMEQLDDHIQKIIHSLMLRFDVTITTEGNGPTAAAHVHPEAEEILQDAILETIGEEYLSPSIVTTGADDFHFYTIKRSNIKATMLALGCDLRPGLHHSKMTFDTSAIVRGSEILSRAVEKTLARGDVYS